MSFLDPSKSYVNQPPPLATSTTDTQHEVETPSVEKGHMPGHSVSHTSSAADDAHGLQPENQLTESHSTKGTATTSLKESDYQGFAKYALKGLQEHPDQENSWFNLLKFLADDNDPLAKKAMEGIYNELKKGYADELIKGITGGNFSEVLVNLSRSGDPIATQLISPENRQNLLPKLPETLTQQTLKPQPKLPPPLPQTNSKLPPPLTDVTGSIELPPLPTSSGTSKPNTPLSYPPPPPPLIHPSLVSVEAKRQDPSLSKTSFYLSPPSTYPEDDVRSISTVRTSSTSVSTTSKRVHPQSVFTDSSGAHIIQSRGDLAELKRDNPNWRLQPMAIALDLMERFPNKGPAKILEAIAWLGENDARFQDNTNSPVRINSEAMEGVIQILSAHLQVPDLHADLAITEIERRTIMKGRANSFITPVQAPDDEELTEDNVPFESLYPIAEQPISRERTESEEEKFVKFCGKVGDNLVGILIREEVESSKLQARQTTGIMQKGEDGIPIFEAGKAIGAEIQKDSNVEIPANVAFVVTEDKGQGTHIITRSSRTDTEDKIHYKSQVAIYAAAENNTLGEAKIDADGKTYYEYQRVDTTCMDTNPLKAAVTTLKTGAKAAIHAIKKLSLNGKPIENERSFVQRKREATDKIWSTENGALEDSKGIYIERQIKKSDGEIITVREYKPMIFNFVLSSQGNTNYQTLFINNVKSARQANIAPALDMLGVLLKKYPVDIGFGEVDTSIDRLRKNYQKNPTSQNATNLAEALDAQIQILEGKINDLQPGEERTKLEDLKMALKGVRVILTGKDMNGVKYDHGKGSGQQILYLKVLADLVGVDITIECKSGNDRTATTLALLLAQEKFKASFGHYFEFQPPKPKTASKAEKGTSESIALKSTQEQTYAEHLRFFANDFTQAIIDFGKPNVLASRGATKEDKGKPVIKLGKSPVFLGLMEVDPEFRKRIDEQFIVK